MTTPPNIQDISVRQAVDAGTVDWDFSRPQTARKADTMNAAGSAANPPNQWVPRERGGTTPPMELSEFETERGMGKEVTAPPLRKRGIDALLATSKSSPNDDASSTSRSKQPQRQQAGWEMSQPPPLGLHLYPTPATQHQAAYPSMAMGFYPGLLPHHHPAMHQPPPGMMLYPMMDPRHFSPHLSPYTVPFVSSPALPGFGQAMMGMPPSLNNMEFLHHQPSPPPPPAAVGSPTNDKAVSREKKQDTDTSSERQLRTERRKTTTSDTDDEPGSGRMSCEKSPSDTTKPSSPSSSNMNSLKSVQVSQLPSDVEQLPDARNLEAPYWSVINFSRNKPKTRNRWCVMCGNYATGEPGGCTIPCQNKDVCNRCDSAVWFNQVESHYFKWCKGCKKFLLIQAFRQKFDDLIGGLVKPPTKCDSCRERGRAGYRQRKAELTSPCEDGLFSNSIQDPSAEYLMNVPFGAMDRIGMGLSREPQPETKGASDKKPFF